jgi:hypothetical protein
MAETQNELAKLDEGWDEDPALSRAETATPFSMAPDCGDLDDGWGEAPTPAAPARPKRPRVPEPAIAKQEPVPVPVTLRLTKRERRDFEKQQRRHAQQRHAESKQARKQARRDEAKQRAAEQRHVPVKAVPGANAKSTPSAPKLGRAAAAAGKMRPSSPKSPAAHEVSRAPLQHESAHDSVRSRAEPRPHRTGQSRNDQPSRRRPMGERSDTPAQPKRKFGLLAKYLILAAIVSALMLWAMLR